MQKKTAAFIAVIFALMLCGGGGNSAYCFETAKIHLLLAIDSGSDDVGNTVAADGVNVQNVFEENIPPSRLTVKNIINGRLTEALILNAVKNVNSMPDDCIILYYSGHGAYDGKQGHYFQFQNETTSLRSTFAKVLKNKNVRLAILLTDCCNVSVNLQKSDLMSSEPAKTSATLPPLFRTLFFESKGFADINASKAGQCSFIYGKGDPRGSIFTWVLCQELKNSKYTNKNWNNLFETIAGNSDKEFRKKYPDGQTIPPVNEKQYIMNPYYWELPSAAANFVVNNNPPVQRKAKLGVRAENTPFRDGVRITDVLPDSAGEAANLHIEDKIIEINGKPIRTEGDYIEAVKTSPKTMKITVETPAGKILTGTAYLE